MSFCLECQSFNSKYWLNIDNRYGQLNTPPYDFLSACQNNNKRGYYGRLLAYILVDGENFNVELVRQGLSPYYTKYGHSDAFDAEFEAAEVSAKRQDLGIWKGASPSREQ